MSIWNVFHAANRYISESYQHTHEICKIATHIESKFYKDRLM